RTSLVEERAPASVSKPPPPASTPASAPRPHLARRSEPRWLRSERQRASRNHHRRQYAGLSPPPAPGAPPATPLVEERAPASVSKPPPPAVRRPQPPARTWR